MAFFSPLCFLLFRETSAAENQVHSSGQTHGKSTGLNEMSAGKQAGGKGETEKSKQPAAQKKRTCTTKHATQTHQALLAADAPFAAALEAIPAEDWCRTWAAGRTIMLRRTSKSVKEVVDKMLLPAVVRLIRKFITHLDQELHETAMRQLPLMTAWCRISTLELNYCDMKVQDVESLAGVVAQCPALVHLHLSDNQIGDAGAERLAGVLAQCPALVHLDLRINRIGTVGEGRLRASWRGQASGLRL
jgi:hypothetical protein